MIIKALSDYYYSLLAKGANVPNKSWSFENVSYALVLDDSGKLTGIVPLLEAVSKGKKTILVSSKILVPEPPLRTSGIVPSFLCNKSSYLLGISDPPDKKNVYRFDSSKKLHHSILDGVNTPEAIAVLNFFDSWNPEKAHEHQALAAYLSEICSANNLIFMFHGKYITEYESIISAWNNYIENINSELGLCIISGEYRKIAKLHSQIRGIRNAQSSGASLVCFNNAAVESYGKLNAQALNAPISSDIMFAYTTALKYMINNCDHHIIAQSDLTMFCWSKSAEDAYFDVIQAVYGGSKVISSSDIVHVISELAKGHRQDVSGILPSSDEEFYILGISPNVSRLSVRFFIKNNFGNFVKNVDEHYNRLQISCSNAKWHTPPVYGMLRETISDGQSSSEKKDNDPQSLLAAAVIKAVFNNTKYPSTLFSSIIRRLKIDHKITPPRAGIIKAYLLKNSTNCNLKEALTLELNNNCTLVPYLLGRAFAVCEAIQRASFGDASSDRTTIKDRYFDSACATPALVFPQILKLKNCHIKQLKREHMGSAVYYEKTLAEILSSVNCVFPKSLNMEEQGIFILGYYHQTEKFYSKKEEE